MVRHSWYVIHIPGTDTYVPLWTFALLILILIVIVSALAFAIGWLSRMSAKGNR